MEGRADTVERRADTVAAYEEEEEGAEAGWIFLSPGETAGEDGAEGGKWLKTVKASCSMEGFLPARGREQRGQICG